VGVERGGWKQAGTGTKGCARLEADVGAADADIIVAGHVGVGASTGEGSEDVAGDIENDYRHVDQQQAGDIEAAECSRLYGAFSP
jgi:hypothetical protein